jgi:hypothetical protein
MNSASLRRQPTGRSRMEPRLVRMRRCQYLGRYWFMYGTEIAIWFATDVITHVESTFAYYFTKLNKKCNCNDTLGTVT